MLAKAMAADWPASLLAAVWSAAATTGGLWSLLRMSARNLDRISLIAFASVLGSDGELKWKR